MTSKNRRTFLDTSVIFAAVLSPSGGARMLFRLSEAGLLKPVIDPNVLRECEEVVRRKAPASLAQLAQLLATGRVESSEAPSPEHLAQAQRLLEYPPDAHVLAEAMAAHPDWFVTHDNTQFLKDREQLDLPFNLGSPGDLIQALKEEFALP